MNKSKAGFPAFCIGDETEMQFTKKDTALVKGVAILMMLFHHCFESTSRFAGYTLNFFPLTEGYTVLIASFFKICVAIFVFLSGYGIAISLSKVDPASPSGYIKQICRRTFSLMSGFWIIFILSIISAAIIMPSMLNVYKDEHLLNSLVFVLYDFLGLAELFGTPTLVGTWWYMSLALIIIAVMPLAYRLYKKYGAVPLLIITFFICGIVKKASSDETVNYDMVRWLFTIDLGMICADRNLLARAKAFMIFKKHKAADYAAKLVIMTAVLLGCFLLRRDLDWTVSYIRDGFIPAFVVLYCYVILAEIPMLRSVLQFLGKHSMNIFMSHTLLRAYFLKDFLYGLGYSMLTFFVLLGLSVLLSIVIDLIKKYSGYDKLCEKIIKKIA